MADMVARATVCLATAAMLAVSACGRDDEEVPQPDMDLPQTITVTSTAFAEGEPIPEKYSCNGANVSPPLAWQGVPSDAAAVALVVDDADAPSGTFTHWVVVDLAPDVAESAEGQVPTGGVQAQSSARQAAYFGPCPPGGTHHYRFTLYALSEKTGLAEGAALADALDAIDVRSVAWGRLTGTYSR